MNECQVEWHLADMMETRGIRNKDLACMAGLHHVTISKLKHAKMPERIESSTLAKLCTALRCSPGDLMRLKEPFQEDAEASDDLDRLLHGERLPIKEIRKSRQSNEGTECDCTSDVARCSHLPDELSRLTTTINYCTETLAEEMEMLPQETKEQMSHLLAVLHGACKKQLSIFCRSGQSYPEAMPQQLGRSWSTY